MAVLTLGVDSNEFRTFKRPNYRKYMVVQCGIVQQ